MPSAAKASDTSGTPRHYTEYVVLYVPPEGSFKDAVKYQLGLDRLALVGTDYQIQRHAREDVRGPDYQSSDHCGQEPTGLADDQVCNKV